MWDANSPVTIIAVSCIIAAAVGGGIQISGHEMPIINSKARQLILAAIGVVLLLAPYVQNSYFGSFRVLAAEVSWDSGSIVSGCNSRLRFTIKITTRKTGVFTYRRVYSNGLVKSTVESVEAKSDGVQVIEHSYDVTVAQGDTGYFAVFVEVLSPNEKVSDTANITVRC
ncbi:hypothetical protein [Nocardia sp. SSK8]|uniref:hypothetical protein n=1 Tax=Nocardia sp. SSK8 TaxID=3120154 RepID=UPI00300B77F7